MKLHKEEIEKISFNKNDILNLLNDMRLLLLDVDTPTNEQRKDIIYRIAQITDKKKTAILKSPKELGVPEQILQFDKIRHFYSDTLKYYVGQRGVISLPDSASSMFDYVITFKDGYCDHVLKNWLKDFETE